MCTLAEVRRTAWKVSSRVITMRTGRPSRRAMKHSSGWMLGHCLPPKPPPRSGAITRTLDSGRPSTLARIFCSWKGCWLVLHTTRPSPSGATTQACGSMAKWVTIGYS